MRGEIRVRAVQGSGELALGGEQDVVALAHGAVAQRLGQMTLAGTAMTDDQNRRFLLQISAGGQVMHDGAIERGQPIDQATYCLVQGH